MRVVSFFAGCGGLDLGFEQAGFNVVWANEFEPHCSATYIRNHPNTEFVLGDVCKINPNLIPDCDGFIGGPPCQSWSVGGKQNGLNDERGKLFLKYIELIKIKHPKFFVIENVKGMLDSKFKEIFEDFIKRLDYAGYNVQWTLIDAVDFCVPQNRERVFFVGFQKDLNVHYEFPKPICFNPISLEQVIGDITEAPNFYVDSNVKVSSNLIRPNHDVLASKFGPFYYRGNRRRGWNQPSFTINATADFAPLHPSSPKMMYYGHENWNFQKDRINEYRRLSVRECARIQTFPDDFIFEYEDIKEAYKMIGNAVPPKLVYEIAKSIFRVLNIVSPDKHKVIGHKNRMDSVVLVGYFKTMEHNRLIEKNLLYYVRSDGRTGSLFKEDCCIMPNYLLIHHKEKAKIYELDGEEPVIVDSSFLKALGFNTSGDNYLCFRLKDCRERTIKELGGIVSYPNYNKASYIPYFTKLGAVINNKRK